MFRLPRPLFLGAILALALAAGGCLSAPLKSLNDYTYVHGSLRDNEGNLVLEPVVVSFGSRSVTTSSGYYTISGIPGGTYEVKISSEHYEPLVEAVAVPSGGTYQHSFSLVRKAGAPPVKSAPSNAGAHGDAPPQLPRETAPSTEEEPSPPSAERGAQPALPPRPDSPAAGAAPQVLRGKVIVVDPGHGGFNRSLGDYGAVGRHSVEKENTLAIAFYLRELLEAAGAEVVMTRESDVNPSVGTRFEHDPHGQLKARVDLANRIGADVFVSIHNNANPNPNIRGIETFYYSQRGRVLAEAIQSELARYLGAIDRGTSWASFYVIRETHMPAVLIEIGFITNPIDDYLLSTESYRSGAAHGIFNGLVRYFGGPGASAVPLR